MFKVSFKDKPKDPSKAVIKEGKTTTVILKGVVNLPSFFYDMPQIVLQWISDHTKVELYENISNNTLTIYSTGVARCHEDDKFDAVLGERLAEARAKYIIYKFFYDLDTRLCKYYGTVLHGSFPDLQLEDKGLMSDRHKYEALCIKESRHIGQLLADKQNG